VEAEKKFQFLLTCYQDRKHKRDEEGKHDKSIKTRLALERKKIDEEEKYSTSNKELYTLFNDLQEISHESMLYLLLSQLH
jgi:hypothetical protein